MSISPPYKSVKNDANPIAFAHFGIEPLVVNHGHAGPMPVSMLFPRDVIAPRQVDEHCRAEAAAARALGLDVSLLDHDALVAGDVGAVRALIAEPTHPLLYRGWMIKPTAWAGRGQRNLPCGVRKAELVRLIR